MPIPWGGALWNAFRQMTRMRCISFKTETKGQVPWISEFKYFIKIRDQLFTYDGFTWEVSYGLFFLYDRNHIMITLAVKTAYIVHF